MSVPITILGGYLGSGKTTLLNRVLTYQQRLDGLAVVVNDFGEINVDAALIRSTHPGADVLELANGCVCCSIQDSFADTLEALRDSGVDRILLEASGVAVPSKLKAQCLYPGFEPAECFVLIDMSRYGSLSEDKYVGRLVMRQIDEADHVVINRNTSDQTVHADSVFTDTDDELLDRLTRQTPGKPVTGDETSSPDFATRTIAADETISIESLRAVTGDLPGKIHRIKGYVLTDEGCYLVQGVPGQIDISPTTSELTTGLIAIFPRDAQPELEGYFDRITQELHKR